MTEREQSLIVVGVVLGAFGAVLLRWLIWTVLDWLAPPRKQASKKRGQPSPYSE